MVTKIITIAAILCTMLHCRSNPDIRVPYLYKQPISLNNEWETADLREVGIDEEMIVELTNEILADQFTEIHSMLIVRNGKLVYEEYFNGFTAEDFHVLFSATKSYSSALIGVALDKGLIASVDQSISEFFPGKESLFVGGKENIKIRDLLTMTSGFEWDEWSTSGLSADNSHEKMMTASSQIDYVLNLELIHPPGATFTYSTGLSNLMAPIVENASGIDVELFAKKNLFDPLKIEHYRWNKVIDEYPSTGGSRGGLEIFPRDMIKLGLLYLNEGLWKGQRVLSAAWVAETLTPRISESANINYCYQWWNRTYFSKNGEKVKEFDAVGDGGQWIFLFPEYNLLVGFTGGNYTWDHGPDLMFQPVNMIQNYILPSLVD